MKKLTSLTSLGISIGLLSINALFAQDNVIMLNQLTEGETHSFNIGSYAENEEESCLQGDLAPQMQINPDEITTELEALEKWFNDLGVSNTEAITVQEKEGTTVQEKRVTVQQSLDDIKIAISNDITEKNNAIQAAKIEIKEHSTVWSANKTIKKAKAEAELIRLERIKEKWDDLAIRWRIAAQENKEENLIKSLKLARVARICELISEEVYQAERIWNVLKEKKTTPSKTEKAKCMTSLEESTKFTEKPPFERSDEFFKQADEIWMKSKIISTGKKIAETSDQVTSVLQHISILGMISPAVISQIISLTANRMDDQEIAKVAANNLEECARKYYAKMARIEAAESTDKVNGKITYWQREASILREKNKSEPQKDPEAIDRKIERAEVRLQAHEEALEVFWPTEVRGKVAAGNVETDIGATSSSSSSSSASSSSSGSIQSNNQPVTNKTLATIGKQIALNDTATYLNADLNESENRLRDVQINRTTTIIDKNSKQSDNEDSSSNITISTLVGEVKQVGLKGVLLDIYDEDDTVNDKLARRKAEREEKKAQEKSKK